MLNLPVIRIHLNGEPYELADGQTVANLLARLDLAGRRVGVELNINSVPRSLPCSASPHRSAQATRHCIPPQRRAIVSAPACSSGDPPHATDRQNRRKEAAGRRLRPSFR